MMNTEDQELLEIEKMLESMKEMEPPPELRGETLAKARNTWQKTSNFSFPNLFAVAAVIFIIFSIGYIVGVKREKVRNETTESQKIDRATEKQKNLQLEKDKVMKSER